MKIAAHIAVDSFRIRYIRDFAISVFVINKFFCSAVCVFLFNNLKKRS